MFQYFCIFAASIMLFLVEYVIILLRKIVKRLMQNILVRKFRVTKLNTQFPC